MNKNKLAVFVQQQLAITPALTNAQLLVNAKAELPTITDTFRVGAGIARGFFVFNKIWSKLRTIQADLVNPLSSLCDAVVITASDANSYFGINPSKAAGAANIAGLDMLVAASIIKTTQKTEFLNLSKTSIDEFKGVTLTDIAVARLSGVQQAHTVTYPIVNLNYLQRNGNQPIRCFVYLDVAAITDTTILIYKQSCASNKDSLVNSNYLRDQQPFGYLTIKTGELGGEFVITKQSAQYLKLMSEADTKQAHSLTLEFA